MANFDRELKNCVEFIQDRLYYVPLSAPPMAVSPQRHFFSIDSELVYWNFFLDFGPLNFGQLYRFCALLNSKLADQRLKDKVIYFFSGTHPHRRANAAFLISAWKILYHDKTPEEAFRPFKSSTMTFPAWHDATPTICAFNLTILDTLKGLYKAKECRFFDLSRFNIDEYETYEQVENGDLNWCLDGKFIAFAGPHAAREMSPGGYRTLTPEDYTSYFKSRNVQLVVRLNKKYYDAKRFTTHGIDHMELYFIDGSNPPDGLLNRFLARSEETPGAIAVHCKAGLGRTGCCIGAYMMKHYMLTAEETIGWLRIVRPGSIIGPQQQYMKDLQHRMWREGEVACNGSVSRPLHVQYAGTGTVSKAQHSGQHGTVSTAYSNSTGSTAYSNSTVNSLAAKVSSMAIASATASSSSSSSTQYSADMKHIETSSSTSRPRSSGGPGGGPSTGTSSSTVFRDSDKEAQGDALRQRRQAQPMSPSSSASSSSSKSDPALSSIVGRTGLNSFMSSWR